MRQRHWAEHLQQLNEVGRRGECSLEGDIDRGRCRDVGGGQPCRGEEGCEAPWELRQPDHGAGTTTVGSEGRVSGSMRTKRVSTRHQRAASEAQSSAISNMRRGWCRWLELKRHPLVLARFKTGQSNANALDTCRRQNSRCPYSYLLFDSFAGVRLGWLAHGLAGGGWRGGSLAGVS